MSAFKTKTNNLLWTVTNGAISSTIGKLMDTYQSKLANNGRDEKVKFYWDESLGGVKEYAARTLIGGPVSAVTKEAVSEYKKLIGGDKADSKQRNNFIDIQESKISDYFDEIVSKYGQVTVNKSSDNKTGDVIYAYDDWGNVCYDALMLSIPVANPVTITIWNDTKNNSTGKQIKSDHLVWYDTTAMVSLSSDKNLLINRVTGRDYSRKELVSNGDMNFSVSGQITSGIPDVYPTKEVQKFRQIMQYKGIVEVNNEILAQWGITKLVIKSYSMPPKEGSKSTQEYSFEAVGIQPNYEANVTEDTIEIIDDTIAKETENNDALSWKELLSQQLENLKNMSVTVADTSASLAESYLDKSVGLN